MSFHGLIVDFFLTVHFFILYLEIRELVLQFCPSSKLCCLFWGLFSLHLSFRITLSTSTKQCGDFVWIYRSSWKELTSLQYRGFLCMNMKYFSIYFFDFTHQIFVVMSYRSYINFARAAPKYCWESRPHRSFTTVIIMTKLGTDLWETRQGQRLSL